jgi:hypothetical protein
MIDYIRCGRTRFNEVENPYLGVGKQMVPYPCPNVATAVVQGEPACAVCALAAMDETDPGTLRQWADEVITWAEQMSHRPEVASWFDDVATEMIRLAGVIERDRKPA